MKPYTLHHGDCLDVLKTFADCSVDAVVTDPPYGLSFMGKRWDYDVPSEDIWRECLRVLKPGGHLLAFAGTRTQHRMAVRIEDAGFEIRDMIAWVYGSGFPKSLDVSKAIDKAAGAEREVIGMPTNGSGAQPNKLSNHTTGDTGIGYADGSGQTFNITAPATEAAKQWEGWGTALKPAFEPITVARKPLIGTVAENVLEHGTGGLNVDGCRVATDLAVDDPRLGGAGTWSSDKMAKNVYEGGYAGDRVGSSPLGRWPANFIHDGSEEVVALFPDSKSCNSPSKARPEGTILGGARSQGAIYPGETGSAARFFYCAKASKKDRGDDNKHPTVKPTDLMRYLCRLVTPPGGLILDPFMGSGSTGKAAMLEGFRFIGIEQEAEYLEIAEARIAHVVGKTSGMLPFE
jgi:DNA modification methylase